MTELHFFDPTQDYAVIERRLPHWAQPGVICFATFRTNDSMPKAVLQRWRTEREDWLRKHSINPIAHNWRKQRDEQTEFYRSFSTQWHDELDCGHGACVLRDTQLARIVGDSLQYANGDLYDLTDFVVMPNHVHLLAAFPDQDRMLVQCTSWKKFTATTINRHLGSKGRFWQQDGFDHLVRSEEQFQHFRRYIADNPKKALLSEGEYLHRSLE